jgi:hypothetical protein
MAVVELKTRPAEVVATVIERLEEVLAEAREGKVVGVAIATINLDGSIGSMWSDTDQFPSLLGSVARLEYRLNHNQNVL